MKILHLSTFDIRGGAARAAYRLHKALQRLGHDSRMLVLKKESDDATVQEFVPRADAMGRMRRRIRRWSILRWERNSRLGLKSHPRFPGCAGNRESGMSFSDSRTQHGGELLRQIPPCDVINLCWVAGLVDYEEFFPHCRKLPPLVWRMSDMNPFTGGCHYDNGCGRFDGRCGRCPAFGGVDERDPSRVTWMRKRQALGQVESKGLHIVAQSRWIMGEVRRSSLMSRFPVVQIPNGIDVDDFKPLMPEAARAIHGIPQDKVVLLFVADHISDKRKGFEVLKGALEGMDLPANMLLVSVGEEEPRLKPEIPCKHLGPLRDNRMLAAAYSAADLFVIPTLQDNMPGVVLESLACGTPVVGFNVGGVPEMVQQGITGDLAEAGDVVGLRRIIAEWTSKGRKQPQVRSACRESVVAAFGIDAVARRYEDLFVKAASMRYRD